MFCLLIYEISFLSFHGPWNSAICQRYLKKKLPRTNGKLLLEFEYECEGCFFYVTYKDIEVFVILYLEICFPRFFFDHETLSEMAISRFIAFYYGSKRYFRFLFYLCCIDCRTVEKILYIRSKIPRFFLI